jgi:hypothetical protein
MRNCIATLLITSFLSGCAASHQVNNDDYSRRKAMEEAGWATLEKLSSDECGATREPPRRARAVELSNCVTGLVYEYVLPHAVLPRLLINSRTEALRMAQDYADGKMSPVEYKLRSEARLKAYSDSMFRSVSRQVSSDLG